MHSSQVGQSDVVGAEKTWERALVGYIKKRLALVKDFTRRFFFVLGDTVRWRLLLLVLGFLFLSLIDLVGLSLIGPFVALATDPDNIDRIPGLSSLKSALDLHSELDFVLSLGVMIFLVFLSKAVAGFYVNRAMILFSMDHQRRTKIKLLQAYLDLPFERAMEKNSSSLLTTVNQHVSIFTNRTMIPILSSLSGVVYILALFLFLLITNPVITLSLAVLFVTILVIYDTAFKKRVLQAGEDSLVAFNGGAQTITQSADGFKEIRVAGVEPYFVARLDDNSRLFADAITYMKSISVVPRYAIETSIVGFVIALMAIGLYFNDGPSPELISTVGMFGFAAIRAMPSVNVIMSSASNLRFGYPALLDLCDDLKEAKSAETSASVGAESKDSLQFKSAIRVENLVYTYPKKSAPALSDVSLCIDKGETIGLIGASGSGKTTLVDTLLGLLAPQSGRIAVDDRDIAEDIRAWMNHIAYIPQSVFLLDDTIRSNIAFGVQDPRDIDPARIAEVVEVAQLSSFIDNLDDGLDTVVGERGTRLSGGQKQRVAIARALYDRRDLLVMDEATAALDNETEKDLVEAVGAIRGKVTTIVVAHRLSTLKYCDRVYRLDDGKIVGVGSYKDLVGGET